MNTCIMVVICLILYPYLTFGLDVFINDMTYIAKVVMYWMAVIYIKIMKLIRKIR